MKRKIPILLIMFLYLLVLSSCKNTSIALKEGNFKYVSKNGQATITQYLGTEEHVVFPSTIKGMPVVAIGDEYLNPLFSIENEYIVKSVTIPDSIVTIKNCAFENCSSLTDVTLGNGVRELSYLAFKDCNKLKYNFYENGYYLGNKDNPYFAFMKMVDSNVQTIKIHSDTNIISCYAFKEFLLSEISFPDSVISIDECALLDCELLEKIYISKNIETIGDRNFNEKDLIKEIIVSEENKHFKSIDGTLFSYDGTRLIKYISQQEESFYQIPEGTKIIDNYAFEDSLYLKEINIPDSVMQIGMRAFCNIKGLKEINIPDSVIKIDVGAFASCENVENIYIGNSVKTIGDSAFADCLSLKEVVIPDSVESLIYSVFQNCTNLEFVVIGSGVQEIGWYVFADCVSLKEVIFKDSEGWGVTAKYSLISKKIDLSDPKKNVEYLTKTYVEYWWDKE